MCPGRKGINLEERANNISYHQRKYMLPWFFISQPERHDFAFLLPPLHIPCPLRRIGEGLLQHFEPQPSAFPPQIITCDNKETSTF
jgi:hypothetical protein